MSVLPKDLVRDFIKEQHFTNTDDVLNLLKEMFKDVLQEALEVELEEKLGYDKYQISDKTTTNSRKREYTKLFIDPTINHRYQKRLNCMTPIEYRNYLKHKIA